MTARTLEEAFREAMAHAVDPANIRLVVEPSTEGSMNPFTYEIHLGSPQEGGYVYWVVIAQEGSPALGSDPSNPETVTGLSASRDLALAHAGAVLGHKLGEHDFGIVIVEGKNP